MFASYLEPTSAFKTQVRGYPVWDMTHELLAETMHAVQVSNWQRQGKKARKSRYPKPVPRPWSQQKQKLTPEDIKTFGVRKSGVIGGSAPIDKVREHLERLNGRAPEVKRG